MSGLEIAPLVMSVLPPAIEYFFAQDAVSMDEDDSNHDAAVHALVRRSKAPRVLFHGYNEVSRRRSPMRQEAVQVTRLSLE